MSAIDAPTSPLEGTPYRSYVYSYPHKTSYRTFDPPIALDDLWAAEQRDALLLYLHVPFCGMRCGFCNLFTRAGAGPDDVDRYLGALQRQAGRVREAIGEARFARFAVGGGTPTYLDVKALERLLDVAEATMGADLRAIPGSVEVSPGTVDPKKLALLVGRGVDRISIGIESFVEGEAAAVCRPQDARTVERALALIRDAGTPTLNIDLIYGLPGQTVATWLRSVETALTHRPEELYLYPLYVRPLTGLGRSGRAWDDLRLACYREARALLRGSGYDQHSMRMFRHVDAPDPSGPSYRCQEDGMVGLGPGARSYTEAAHYATEYAVAARAVRAIIDAYTERSFEAFGYADHGRWIGPEDRRRRFVIQSLLQVEGLSLSSYVDRFGTEALDDLPELRELPGLGLAEFVKGQLMLTEAGLERSDAIGPWLYSDEVRAAIEDYRWR